MNYCLLQNNQTVLMDSIPVLGYEEFSDLLVSAIRDEGMHCVNYYGFEDGDKIKLIGCLADDQNGSILVLSSLAEKGQSLTSITPRETSYEKYEREIHENFGIRFTGHPWMKPVRFPSAGAAPAIPMDQFPFFQMNSEELHEVGVGPIHAGIIEPGHFRFICNGEQVRHLEIQLGYQHRGIEALFVEKIKPLERITLAENIAGDTVAGHAITYVNLWESLCGFKPGDDLKWARTLALELERIAVHTGDLSALSADIGYQLGSSVYGRLRTPVLNFIQTWCGNRLAKGLIRAGKNNYDFTQELKDDLINVIGRYLPDFNEMNRSIVKLPSVLSRFERTGILTSLQAREIGAVGMTARSSGIMRDIRATHPHDWYAHFRHEPVVKHHGDVYSRFQLRREEIKQSINYIRKMLDDIPEPATAGEPFVSIPAPSSFTISLVEGWRGEICHCAVTDPGGKLIHYKIKDPSFNNWMGLALAVRNNEISDFPVCNKSFNLSYCGHDL
jgi:Ni,Fe-hydrogenase III large subunit